MIPQSEGETKKTPRGSGSIWNLLTGLVILGIVLMVGYFVLIYQDPESPINLFPPAPLPAAYVLPTPFPSPTPLVEFPPTWTVTASPLPTLTNTPRPETATPTEYAIPRTPGTSTPVTPSSTISPTIKANMPYELAGTPVAVASVITHPDSDCSWMGVGGQVMDLSNAPIVGVTIQLSGVLGDKYLDLLSLTGTALEYGPAGYEFTLADKPIASKQTLWVQLLDQAGLPLSEKIYFNTTSDCSKNLILIKFKQVR